MADDLISVSIEQPYNGAMTTTIEWDLVTNELLSLLEHLLINKLPLRGVPNVPDGQILDIDIHNDIVTMPFSNGTQTVYSRGRSVRVRVLADPGGM